MTSALARALVLDELFDLALYRSVRRFASGDLALMLDELITIETRHAAFWQRFFGVTIDRLDRGRHIKLAMLSLACRVFMARRIDPERVRNFFLGFNDGLVEILGAVSGFFAAFSDVASVLVASCTVAVAGALSMAAGAFAAAHSEREVRRVETGKRAFLGEAADAPPAVETSATGAAILVGVSYLVGACVSVLPVLLGAQALWASLAVGVAAAVVVSATLAFLSGMAVRRRIAINLALLAAAVVVTYVIGRVTTRVWGISV